MPPLNQNRGLEGGQVAPGAGGIAAGVHRGGAQVHADEFPPGASEWPEGLNRRQFLEVMGASLALAGLGACNRPPEKTIVPYVTAPDRQFTDGALYYATAMPWEGYGRGVLALSHAGRPTKLEGNPAHPDSLGASDIFMQASVLALYDPDRSRAPRQRQNTTAWEEFEAEWLTAHAQLRQSRGAKLALLVEPTTSPTLLRGIHHFLDTFPEARWYQHMPLPRYDRNGTQDDYDFEKADIVLAIESDFLLRHPASLRYARAFAGRRRIEHGRVNGNRLYAIESAFTTTGSMADHRLPASPARQRALLAAVGDALHGKPTAGGLTEEERQFIAALAADLHQKAPNVLCVAGETADAGVRDWAAAVNAQLGAAGVTWHALPAVRSDADPRAAGDLTALVHAMGAREIETLVILGTNPAYTAPAELKFHEALHHVTRRIHLGSHVDETAALCEWHVPESHYLEVWSDLRAYDGTVSVVQPLIAPMYASRSAAEFVFFLADGLERSDYDLVRETWQPKNSSSADFERQWQQVLNKGIADGTASKRTKPAGGVAVDAGSGSSEVTAHGSEVGRTVAGAPRPGRTPRSNPAASAASTTSVTLVIQPDPTVGDGRWANNGWLQELPKPNWQLVWDNAAQVSPAYAGHHGLKTGDVVTLRTAAGFVDAPIWIGPGVADDCVIVYLGYGRVRAGTIGNRRGFDAYRLRRAEAPWSTELLELRKTHGRAELVSTHSHYTMEGRDIVRVTTAANPTGARPEAPPSMFPDWKYNGYRWGMAIDLGACIGCKACVIACQAENNIAVVGKDQVSRGREMHWIRVDQYYDGNPDNPQVFHQPVPCMQCERAPCEVVCPVAATVHSAEGLNDMVYNRCIGTRYCSNNCPYKVRRFNFLDYRDPKGSTLYLQKNPEVTVRARGVMEKCSYCVQRIDAARITAEREDRRVRDGELRTACQQACPAEAIAFGDLNDPNSRVRARKAEPTNYALLEELNTQPRTTYLAKIVNRNDAVFAAGGKNA